MTSQTTLHRRPIRGFIWGLVLGLGVTGLLMVFSIIELSIPNLIIYTAVVAVLGVLWGLFAPPKKPKGPAPRRADFAAPPTSAPSYEEKYPETAADMPPRAEAPPPAVDTAPPPAVERSPDVSSPEGENESSGDEDEEPMSG